MKLSDCTEITEQCKRGRGLISKAITVTAEYDSEKRSIDYETVEIWLKEDNKAAMEVSKLMDSIGAFNAIVDRVEWDKLYAATGNDEVFNYETQDQ